MLTLRPYQQEDVIRTVKQKCIGNFSEQRTGKTPTTCASLSALGIKHALIVCPASLMYVWKEQWKAWTGNDAYVIQTTTETLEEIPYDTCVICNYEKIRGNKNNTKTLDTLLKWNPEAVIVDEAHRMKDRKSLTARALNQFHHVPVRIALTGTPATNKPWDVWSILHWLFPTLYRSYWKFINEYFEEETIWVFGEPHREPARFKKGMEQVLQMNLDSICIQHKRKDVMTWLPEEIAPIIVKLPANKQQQKAIDNLLAYFEYKHIITQNALENLIRVRQVCAAPAILNLPGKSPKLEWLRQYLTDYPEKNILIFSNSKKFLRYIQKELSIHPPMICGDVLPKQRNDIVKKFQEKGGVLLLQTQACKEGLTLDTADVSIFLDTYPPAADYLQAKDRMVATVEERNKPKEIIHVMLKDTYDESIFALVNRNISETAIINDYKNYIQERRNSNGKK